MQLARFRELAGELDRIGAGFCFVNDSPDDTALAATLGRASDTLRSQGIPVEVVTNDRNMGFVESTNRGLAMALARGTDALLLNSDALPHAGCLEEIAAVGALDDKIGFVGPRSNDATLATIPWQRALHVPGYDGGYRDGGYRDGGKRGGGPDGEAGEAAWAEALAAYTAPLERFTYVPVATGFCLLVRCEVLRTAGLLDTVYSPGYNEENDLMMRANRLGFRVALANHAYCEHRGSHSFGATRNRLERDHSMILDARYPEYRAAVDEHFRSPQYRAEQLLGTVTSFSRYRSSVLVDLRLLARSYNGTFELATRVLRHITASPAWRDRYQIVVAADRRAIEFHGLSDCLSGIDIHQSLEDVPEPCTVALRLTQYYNWDDMLSLARMAPLHVVYHLDTIAADCYYIRYQSPKTHQLWKAAARMSDAMLFFTGYDREKFQARYGSHEDRLDAIAMPSLRLADYVPEARPAPPAVPPYALVIGNSYAHKMVNPTVDVLHRHFPDLQVKALGYTGTPPRGVIPVRSGDLPEGDIDALYTGAAATVFPSSFEGFGLPILRTLAYGKPIICRSSPLLDELIAKSGDSGIMRFTTEDDLVAAVGELLSSPPVDPGAIWSAHDQSHSWDSCVSQMLAAIDQLIPTITWDKVASRQEEIDMIRSYLAAREAGGSQGLPAALRHPRLRNIAKRVPGSRGAARWLRDAIGQP